MELEATEREVRCPGGKNQAEVLWTGTEEGICRGRARPEAQRKSRGVYGCGERGHEGGEDAEDRVSPPHPHTPKSWVCVYVCD